MESKLEKIKSIRKSEIEKLAASPLKRKVKKIVYLLKYGMPLGKFIKYAFSYLFIIPIAKIKTNLKSKPIKKKYFENGTNDTCYIAVNIGNAGIGDAIVAIRFLRDFTSFVTKGTNGHLVFDVFYRSPDSIKFITAALPNVRSVLNLPDYTLMRKFYDIDLKLNTFFIKEEINDNELSRKKISEKFPSILKITENIKTNRSSLEKYIKTRPFSEGILSDAVTAMGLSRAVYLNNTAGIATPDDTLKLKIDIYSAETITSKFNLQGVKFITVHDGWDENTKTKTGSSTKSYPPQKWQELVSLLKHEFPDYTVVQLGGLGNGSDITGIDLNLRGKTTLKEAASLLAVSSLHIDTDSGLVHIAVSLGTPCAVLYGPTNADYCSYSRFPNYITVTQSLCGNCWWSTDDWMENCPRGLNASECMNSIEPIDIIKSINEIQILNK
ncbi:MAG: hypothetical protein EVJ48_06370 [Candidatus Acidulodesulfobacterium acidiphilum]|uniref:Glycosyltransferase family 9 protein n=1 Tax=Candidatus Acidulodesulfobacterium acidiphilum TaxID=2597224 RepID=A0A520XC10_9DELT|nr:MAG: hypothetical protein EVJ48_06370 [Candidatus Acidulodesulfobacterium acidiphilum]